MGLSILVTGASGFIGSFMVEEALNRGHEVWAGVRSSSSRKYLQDERIRFVELDFSDEGGLSAQLSRHKGAYCKWDYIIHCAGVTKCKNKSEFERSNYLHTKNFVNALTDSGMVPQLFVYVSTLGTFGPVREKDFLPIKDTDKQCPNTAYGRSKLMAEKYMQSVQGFPYILFRPTGVYGPRERDYYLLAKSIKNHLDIAPGFGRQDLTFVYVKDLVRAIFLAIDKKAVRKAYFISDGGVYSGRDFSACIQKELGNPFVIHAKCPLFILKTVSLLAELGASVLGKSSTLNIDKYQIMKQRNWQCDIAPLTQDLGYRPEYDLEKGVKETIAWYKKEGWL